MADIHCMPGPSRKTSDQALISLGAGRQEPDIAQVTGAVTRWNIQATAQCDRQMREVAAETLRSA